MKEIKFPKYFYKYVSCSSNYFKDCLELAVFASRYYFSNFESLDDPSERTIILERLEGAALHRIVIDSINRTRVWRSFGLMEPLGYGFSDFGEYGIERPEVLQSQFEEIFARASRDAKVYCVSEVWDNPSLWAHYANNSEGICLELAFIPGGKVIPDLVGHTRANTPTSVVYSDVPPRVSLHEYLHLADTVFELDKKSTVSEETMLKMAATLQKMLCSKSRA